MHAVGKSESWFQGVGVHDADIFELQKYKLDFYHMIFALSELVNVWLKNNNGSLE